MAVQRGGPATSHGGLAPAEEGELFVPYSVLPAQGQAQDAPLAVRVHGLEGLAGVSASRLSLELRFGHVVSGLRINKKEVSVKCHVEISRERGQPPGTTPKWRPTGSSGSQGALLRVALPPMLQSQPGHQMACRIKVTSPGIVSAKAVAASAPLEVPRAPGPVPLLPAKVAQGKAAAPVATVVLSVGRLFSAEVQNLLARTLVSQLLRLLRRPSGESGAKPATWENGVPPELTALRPASGWLPSAGLQAAFAATDNQRRSALRLAVDGRHWGCILPLVEAKCDPRALAEDLKSPLTASLEVNDHLSLLCTTDTRLGVEPQRVASSFAELLAKVNINGGCTDPELMRRWEALAGDLALHFQPPPGDANWPCDVFVLALEHCPSVDLEQALALQRELLAGFSTVDFQRQLQELLAAHPTRGRQFNVERQKLFLTVQSNVLPNYGFEGTSKGVFHMVRALTTFNGNAEFDALSFVLSQALGLVEASEDASEPQEQPAAADTEMSEVQLTVRHAVNIKEEAYVFITPSATMKDVRRILSEQLRRPDILKSGRLVRKAGDSGAFASLAESDTVGSRRVLLLMGVENLSPSAGAPTLLSRPQALSLQRDLWTGFASEEFQKKLSELEQTHGRGSLRFGAERQKLALSVQEVVLPRYGFEAGSKGVADMLSAFQAFNDDVEFQSNGGQLNQLLRLDAASNASNQSAPAAGSADESLTSGATEVEVVVKHATTEEEVKVTVSGTATMQEVKEAVARSLGRPDVSAKARLVRRAGGALAGFKDSERLGDRRSVLLVGLENLSPAAGESGLSREQALSLQVELREGFAAEDFQRQLLEIESLGRGTKEFKTERTKLFLSVQSKVLPKYGFEGSPKGVMQMMGAFAAYNEEEEFQRNGFLLNQLLRLDVPEEVLQEPAVSSASAAAADATTASHGEPVVEEVQVLVKSAVKEEDQVRISLPATASIRDVKEALATKLGRPEVIKKGRIVRKVGDSGSFASMTEGEKLGSRRTLLVMGIEDFTPVPVPGPSPNPSQKPERAVAPATPELTLEQALSLQKDLLQGFSEDGFQQQLKALHLEHTQGTRQFNVERQKLFLTVQSQVLPRYGFEGSQRGVFHMMQALNAFNGHQEFDALGYQLNVALGLVQEGPIQVQAKASQLTREAALQLLQLLRTELETPDAQREISQLESAHPRGSSEFEVSWRGLISRMSGTLLRSHGFADNQQGLADLAQALDSFHDEEIGQARLILQGPLGSGTPPEEPPDVEVVVKHAVSGEEVRVELPPTASLRELREMVATKLRRPEVGQRGRLVRRAGASFTSLPDDERLGSRTSALITGVAELSRDPSAPASLTRSQALRLQRALLAGFAQPSFQERLNSLEQEHGWGSRKFQTERQKLALTVQAQLLPKYGFEANAKGVFEMTQAYQPFTDQEFQTNGFYFSQLLRQNAPSQQPQTSQTSSQEPEGHVQHPVAEVAQEAQAPGAGKFLASTRAVYAEQGKPDVARATLVTGSSLDELPSRLLTLHFAHSGFEFQTRIPAEAAPDAHLKINQLRTILLSRGLVSSAEHTAFFDSPPGLPWLGDREVQCQESPVPLEDESPLVDVSDLWVLQVISLHDSREQ